MARERLECETKLGNAVEFGCGTGFNTEVLAARADRLVATDLPSGMLSVKTKYQSHQRDVSAGGLSAYSFPDSAFDAVFLGLALHFTDPPKALAECIASLNPAAL